MTATRVLLMITTAVVAVGCESNGRLASAMPSTAPSPTAQAPLIAGVTVTAITSAGATITWTTDQAASGFVDYDVRPFSVSSQSVRRSGSTAMQTAHTVQVSGLAEGTQYYFRVESRSASGLATVSDISTFVTIQQPGNPASGIAVLSFTMIEFQYSGYPNRWFYAPQVEVIETSGTASATVTKVSFTLPGFGPVPSAFTHKCIAAGERRQLFAEVYGDFEFSIDNSSVGRALPGNTSAEIVFLDASGRQGVVSVSGPIVPGHLPSTYSNPPTTWPCVG